MKFDNLNDIRVLIETARAGSLTGASYVLGVTPAAVSASLKKLEKKLDTRLFERTTRALRLTTQGQTLLDYASRAMDLMAEGEALLKSDSASISGLIRIAASTDLTRSVLLSWFDEFLALHPGLQIHVSVSDQIQDVTRDAVDVALRYGDLHDSQLMARKLCVARRVICASPEYIQRFGQPQIPADLKNHNCLSFLLANRRYLNWQFERDGQQVEVRVSGNRMTDDASIVHQWALAGVGITYKSELDLMHDIASGALVVLLPDWKGVALPLNAVLPSNRFITMRVRALVDFLEAKFSSTKSTK